MRHALAILLVASAWTRNGASADHCHPPAPVEPRRAGLRLWASLEGASYDTARYEGTYEGLSLGLSYHQRWIRARVVAPAYRLTRNGLSSRGWGDVFVEASVPVLRAHDDAITIGLSAGGSLPTGEASDELGMGHAMLVPGLWTEWQLERLLLLAQLSYARAATTDAGEHERHGAGTRPIVSPMNASELAGAVTAAYRLDRSFRVRAGAYGARPVAIDEGSSRAIAVLGADILLELLDFGIEAQAPFIGDPFSFKMLVTAGVRF